MEGPALRRSDWAPHSQGLSALTRPERAAEELATLATRAEPGERLGSKDELRTRCGVSVGTFNEALRLVQARGIVSVRPGPGGGLFAARPSPMVRLGNSVLSLDEDAASVADAVRIRNALDPLLVADALRYSSVDDVAAMYVALERMKSAAEDLDGTAFIHANWALHKCIAHVSPNAVLRSIYIGLLDLVESHTLSVQPYGEHPLPEYMRSRYELHVELVDAIAAGDDARALAQIHEHNATLTDTDTYTPQSEP